MRDVCGARDVIKDAGKSHIGELGCRGEGWRDSSLPR